MWWWWSACSAQLPPDQAGLVVEELTFVDDTRETPALGTLVGSPGRALRTRVWIGPATGEAAVERPLLLVAHGFDGAPEKFEAFASDLARAGVVVAAPAFPVTTFGSGAGVLGASDLPQQPADLGFVLDHLLDEVEDRDSPLWHRFRPADVAVLGHSLGGATVLGWTRFTEPELRVRAVVTLSPATPLLGVFGTGPSADGAPILLAHGIEDETLAFDLSVALYDTLADPVWLLGIDGGDHSGPLESQVVPATPQRSALQDGVSALLAEVFSGREGAVDDALRGLAAEGNQTAP